MAQHFIEPRAKKYVKDMDFCHLQESYLANLENNYWILVQKYN